MLNFELPEGYTMHDGKSCPVDFLKSHKTIVSVYFADASTAKDVCNGETAAFWEGNGNSWWCWDEVEDEEDRIVAWRIEGEVNLVVH